MLLKSYSQVPEILQLLAMDYAANAVFPVWKIPNPYDQMCTACILARCCLEYTSECYGQSALRCSGLLYFSLKFWLKIFKIIKKLISLIIPSRKRGRRDNKQIKTARHTHLFITNRCSNRGGDDLLSFGEPPCSAFLSLQAIVHILQSLPGRGK